MSYINQQTSLGGAAQPSVYLETVDQQTFDALKFADLTRDES